MYISLISIVSCRNDATNSTPIKDTTAVQQPHADSSITAQKTIANPNYDLNALKVFCHSNEFALLFRLVSESDLPNKERFFSNFDRTLNDSNLVNKYFTASEDGGNEFVLNDKFVVISYNASRHNYGALVFNRDKKTIYADDLRPNNLLDDKLEVTAAPSVYNKKTNSDDYYENEGILNLETQKIVWTKKVLDHSNPREY